MQEEPTIVQRSSFLRRVRNYLLPSRRAEKNKRKERDEEEASDRSGHSPITSTSNSMDGLGDKASTYYNSAISVRSKEEMVHAYNRSLSVPGSSILSWGRRKRKQQPPLPQTTLHTDIEVGSKVPFFYGFSAQLYALLLTKLFMLTVQFDSHRMPRKKQASKRDQKSGDGKRRSW